MPFQIALPWIVMIPMIFGSSLVNIPLFLAFLLASIGLSAMHIVHMTKKEEVSEAVEEEATVKA